MTIKRLFTALLSVFTLFTLFSSGALAHGDESLSQGGERITRYHTEVEILQDRSFVVTEEISVYTTGSEIKRGIFRDIPTVYGGERNLQLITPLEVLSVTRDGEPDNFWTSSIEGGVRIWVGREEYYLPINREYSYVIRYETDGHMFVEDGIDRVLFNAIGDGWTFEIDEASSRIVLPKSIDHDDLVVTMATTSGAHEIGEDISISEQDGKTVIDFNTAHGLRCWSAAYS